MARVLIVQGHAVRMAHEQGPEVILLDPMLPDRSGYELYASLQRDPATLAIPVLFLPGELPPVTAEEGEVPVALPDIVTRLGLALRTKSLNAELRLRRGRPPPPGLRRPAARVLPRRRHRGPPRGRGKRGGRNRCEVA